MPGPLVFALIDGVPLAAFADRPAGSIGEARRSLRAIFLEHASATDDPLFEAAARRLDALTDEALEAGVPVTVGDCRYTLASVPVAADPPALSDRSPWLLRGPFDGEDGWLFWSNTDGWAHRATADAFTDQEQAAACEAVGHTGWVRGR